jgi:hypothetical protein
VVLSNYGLSCRRRRQSPGYREADLETQCCAAATPCRGGVCWVGDAEAASVKSACRRRMIRDTVRARQRTGFRERSRPPDGAAYRGEEAEPQVGVVFAPFK